MTDQLVEIQLAGGLDEKTARKLVAPGSFLDLVNARFDANGQISQRYGTVRLATDDLASVALPAPRAGHGYRDLPVLITDDKIYAFSTDQAKFVDRGRISTPQVSRRPLADLGSAFTSIDHCYLSGLHVVIAQVVAPNA